MADTGSANVQVQQRGVSVWLDDLCRSQLHNGSFRERLSQGITGVTTNPSIFAGALSSDPLYQEALHAQEMSVDEALWSLMIEDVRAACDQLAPVYARAEGTDGHVSLEVSPRLAHDAAATVVAARDLWQRVDRRNLLIKVPATPAGIEALRTLIAEGISVNATLIFSLDQYRAAHNAYLCGLETALSTGHDIRTVHSVASVFVSRLDTIVDSQVQQSPQHHHLLGQAGIANAILTHEAHLATLDTPRWESLHDDGARPQRVLWASTGVKNDAYPPTLYATALAIPGTVVTLPPVTFEALCASKDELPSVITHSAADAVLAELAELGVDYGAITDRLAAEGITAFCDAWSSLERSVSTAQGVTSPASHITGSHP